MRTAAVLAVSGLAVVAAARPAAANQCETTAPIIVTPEVPLGCPLYAVVPEGLGVVDPTFVARRGDVDVPIDSVATFTSRSQTIYVETIDPSCHVFTGYSTIAVDAYTVTLTGVEVGDGIHGGLGSATIVAAGPCPPPLLPDVPMCQDPLEEFAACDGVASLDFCTEVAGIAFTVRDDLGVGCVATLVSPIAFAAGATFELWRAGAVVDTAGPVEAAADTLPRTEIQCDGSTVDGAGAMYSYTALFAGAEPGDVIRIRDDTAYYGAIDVVEPTLGCPTLDWAVGQCYVDCSSFLCDGQPSDDAGGDPHADGPGRGGCDAGGGAGAGAGIALVVAAWLVLGRRRSAAA